MDKLTYVGNTFRSWASWYILPRVFGMRCMDSLNPISDSAAISKLREDPQLAAQACDVLNIVNDVMESIPYKPFVSVHMDSDEYRWETLRIVIRTLLNHNDALDLQDKISQLIEARDPELVQQITLVVRGQ